MTYEQFIKKIFPFIGKKYNLGEDSSSEEEKYEYKGVKYAHHAKMTPADMSLILDEVSTTVQEYIGSGSGVIMDNTYSILTKEGLKNFEPQYKLICSETPTVFVGQKWYMPDCYVSGSAGEYINTLGLVDPNDPTDTIELNASDLSFKKFALITALDESGIPSQEVYFTAE